jgi:hypothetical protein
MYSFISDTTPEGIKIVPIVLRNFLKLLSGLSPATQSKRKPIKIAELEIKASL